MKLGRIIQTRWRPLGCIALSLLPALVHYPRVHSKALAKPPCNWVAACQTIAVPLKHELRRVAHFKATSLASAAKNTNAFRYFTDLLAYLAGHLYADGCGGSRKGSRTPTLPSSTGRSATRFSPAVPASGNRNRQSPPAAPTVSAAREMWSRPVRFPVSQDQHARSDQRESEQRPNVR